MLHLNWPAWLPQEMIQSLRLYRKEGMLLLKKNITQTLIMFIDVTLSCICFGGTVINELIAGIQKLLEGSSLHFLIKSVRFCGGAKYCNNFNTLYLPYSMNSICFLFLLLRFALFPCKRLSAIFSLNYVVPYCLSPDSALI